MAQGGERDRQVSTVSFPLDAFEFDNPDSVPLPIIRVVPPWGLGGTWYKITDPATGAIATKTSGWTADSFSGGLTVDFSSAVPVGTKAVRIGWFIVTAGSNIYYRKGSDSNISNTPGASGEYSHLLCTNATGGGQWTIWISSTYTVDFAVSDVTTDLYIGYPVEYML